MLHATPYQLIILFLCPLMQCTSLLSLLLAVTVLCTPTAAAAAELEPPQPLVPFDYINYQLLDLDTGVKVYKLVNLRPNTSYEVRVSFPASIPATLSFTIVEPPSSTAAAAAGHQASLLGRFGRRLLDSEKIIFRTDDTGAVKGVSLPHLELRAFRRSVHRQGPKGGAPKLVYNIVLAELLIALPADTVPTVATIVLIVLLAALWAFYWSNQYFPKLLDYLTADNTVSSSSSSSKAAECADISNTPSDCVASGTAAAVASRKKPAARSQSKRSS